VDGEAENPELIWNSNSKKTLERFLSEQLDQLYTKQSSDLSYDWELNIDSCSNIHQSSEIIVGGIYLRVYNNCPSYCVRRPRDFLKDLLEHTFTSPTPECTASINILLSTNPHLTDALVHMGYVDKIVNGLGNVNLRRFCVEVLRFFGRSRAVVGELGQQSLTQITTTLAKNHHIDLLSESLQSIFSNKNPELVRFALKTELIPVLLSFLKGKDGLLSETGQNPSSIKANIVSCLQSMSEIDGEVGEVLKKSEVWMGGGWAGQKHDLFLEGHQTGGYLMGSDTGRYLTEGGENN